MRGRSTGHNPLSVASSCCCHSILETHFLALAHTFARLVLPPEYFAHISTSLRFYTTRNSRFSTCLHWLAGGTLCILSEGAPTSVPLHFTCFCIRLACTSLQCLHTTEYLVPAYTSPRFNGSRARVERCSAVAKHGPAWPPISSGRARTRLDVTPAERPSSA